MRQAGLSQIPLSMGTPVQQAGLGGPPAAPGQAAAAGVASPAVTMGDRSAIVAALAGRGMSFDEIQVELANMGLVAPQESVAEISPERASLGDVFRQGTAQLAGMAVTGAGAVADRAGVEGALDRATEISEGMTALTPEEEAARQVRAEEQGLLGEIGDAAVGSIALTPTMIASGVVGGWLGGIAGSAFGPAGTVAGAVGGRKIGAAVGTFLPALPTMIGSSIERAKEHGHDVNDPEVQNTAIATGAARAVLETFGIERLGRVLMGPATDIAKRSLAKAAAKGAGQFAVIEAAAEAAGEILEIAVFDPEIRAQMSEGELANIATHIKEKYGRDIAIGSAAGALVGGGLGGPGATFQQNKVNATRAQDVETLAGVAEEGGVSREELEAAAQDPDKVPALAQAARELGQSRRDLQQAQTVMDAVAQNPDPKLVKQAEDNYRAAVKKADETYDRVMKPFGALSSQQIEAKKEQTAQRAREVLVDKDVATKEAVDAMDRQTVGAYAATLANAESRLEAANEAMRSGEMYDSQKRTAAQAELKAATNELQKVKDDIAVRTGKTTPEGIKQEAKRRDEQRQYDEATDRQYARKFEPLMTRDPEAAVAEAERIIEANKTDADKGLNTAIRKLETKLDKASTVPEIEKLEAEIADKRSRLGRQPPIVAAARRVLETAGPRQGGAAVQGTSPAAARQSPEPQATTATASPDAASTAPASVPEPAQGQPEAAPEATPQAQPSAQPPVQPQAAVPEGAVSTPQPAAKLPQELSKAAPRYKTDQVEFSSDIDRAAYITAQTKPSKRDADFLSFVQQATGMTVDQVRAHGAQVRAAVAAAPSIDGVRAVPEVPIAAAPVAATPPADAAPPEGGVDPSTTPTREQARQQAEADAATAATQARLDREYQSSPAPTFPDSARASGASGYVDMLDAFGRRTATTTQARKWVRDLGNQNGVEYYVSFDRATGEVLGAGTVNHASRVAFSDATSEALRSGRDVELVHNHPKGTTLSHVDMALLYRYPGNSRVTAVAPDGSTYTAEPTDAGRKAFGDKADKILKELTTFSVTGNRTYADQLAQSTLNGWLREGVISRDANGAIPDADLEAVGRGIRRAINRAVGQEGLMRYTEAGPRELQTSREQNAYDQGVKNARKIIRDRFVVSDTARARRAGAGSGNVQRSGTVRSGRSGTSRNQGRTAGRDGTGLAEPDGSPATGAGVSAVAPDGRRGSGRSTVARQPRTGETVAGLTPSQVYETTGGTTVYEVAAPQEFTQRAQDAVQTIGPIGAQVGTDPGTRQFLMHDGKAGFALDGDNIISVFTTADAPSGVMDAVLELGVDEGGRRLDAFDTFLPAAYARRGFKAVARLPFSREYAPDGWDYGFFQDTFGNSDPDVVFMVYDPDSATPDTDNTIADYDDGIAAQQAAIDEGGLAEITATPQFRAWFGDSKVVNPDGSPKVVYHGSTARGLEQFDTTLVTERGRGDEAGTYFTDDQMAAVNYTRPRPGAARGPRERGQVYAAYLSLQNPLDTTDAIAAARAEGIPFGDAKRQALQALDRDIHDGVMFRGDDVNPAEYVAFSPTQIKSTRNTGAFDPQNPNIMAETAELPQPNFMWIRRGQGAGRQYPTWHDFSQEIDANLTRDEAAAEVARRGADGFEHAITTRDADGTVLGAGTNRARNAVATSDAALEYFRKDIAPVTMTHNHPIMSPLSFADLQMVFSGKSPTTVVAVLPDGSREIATLTPAARAMIPQLRATLLSGAEFAASKQVKAEGLPGAVQRAQATADILARAGVIEYTPAMAATYNTKVEKAVQNAADEISRTNPSLRDTRDTGRSSEPGRSPADDTAALGPEAVRSIRSQSDRAIENARPDREVTGKAFTSQYPDPIIGGLAESADIPGLSADAQAALTGYRDAVVKNRDAFKAARPDLHPMVLDSQGNPIVVFHGTQAPGFTEFADSASGTFTAANPDTAVTYSGEFMRDMQDKIARFRTEDATIEQVLTSPELARDLAVNISRSGVLVDNTDLATLIPEGSRWEGILFPDGRPTDETLNIQDVPILDSQIAQIQQEFGITPEQWDSTLKEPYYQALTSNGMPLPDMPRFPVARDLMRALTARKQAMGIDPPSTSRRKGELRTGDVYPLFVDMTNPLVVDYEGRNWNDAPETLVRAFLQTPDGSWRQMDFDYADYGGPQQAEVLANAWLDQQATELYGGREQAAAADATPAVMHRPQQPTTNAWSAHAQRTGHDGVIFQNIRDSGSRVAPIDDVFVVFRPEQLKHALDNEGTFRRDDPNILHEDRQTVPQLAEGVKTFNAAQKRAKKTLQPPAWLDVKTQQGSAIQAAIDIAKTPGVITKFAQFVEIQMVNQMAAIRNYELRTRGMLGLGMDSMFKAAEIAVNDPGRNEALLYYGAAKMGPNGEFRVAEGTIGLQTMLKKLPDGEAVLDWMEYMGARRAQEIRGKGLETPLTDADITAGLAKETPLFKEVAADWKKFNDANVDFLVDSGRISKALAATLKADAAYVPFYRSEETMQGIHDLMDDAGIRKASISRRGGAVLQRDPGIKKLTGGKTRKVNNLIENMIRNSQAMIGAGMRNSAANKSFDILNAAGDVSLLPARRKTAEGDYVNVTAPKNALRMWKDGGEQFVIPETPAALPVLVALAGMQPVRLGGIHKAMAAVGSFFRQSITLSPSFIVRNMIRDAISTGVLFQGKNLTPDHNMFKGFMSSLRHSASRQAYSAQSGMGDFKFGGTDIGLGKNDILIELGVMEPTKLGQIGYQFRRAVGKMEALGTASELSNRVAIYEALIDSNVRPDEAAYQALTITNYSRKGANSQLQMLLPLVPFLNARIQGVSRIWEDATARRGQDRNQALMKLATSGAILAAASALLWGWNNGDEERREQYQAEPLHRRLNYHIFYAGDRKFLIPKAFEVGTVFGTIPELFMQAAVEGDTSELGSATLMTLTNTFAFNPIPQAIMPALEVMTDYNFFTGRPIEGQRLSGMLREDRVNPQTSALAAALARSGLGSFAGLSPVQMDHLLGGYGGVAYSSLAATIDTVAGELGMLPERPTGVFGDIPVINSALENTFRSMFKQRDADPSSRWVEDFYQTRAAITQIYRSARAAALTGDVERARQLLAAAPATPAAYRMVNKAGAQLSDINSAIRQIQSDPKLTGKQKRQKLDPLINARNKLAAQVAKIIREAEEKQGTSFRRVAA